LVTHFSDQSYASGRKFVTLSALLCLQHVALRLYCPVDSEASKSAKHLNFTTACMWCAQSTDCKPTGMQRRR